MSSFNWIIFTILCVFLRDVISANSTSSASSSSSSTSYITGDNVTQSPQTGWQNNSTDTTDGNDDVATPRSESLSKTIPTRSTKEDPSKPIRSPTTKQCNLIKQEDTSIGFNFLSYLFGVLTVLLLIVIVIFISKILKDEQMNQALSNTHRHQKEVLRGSMQLTEMGLANGLARDNILPVIIEVKTLPPIKADELSVYIKEQRANGNLRNQFGDLIPSNPALAMIAAAADNVKKNRYRNIFPNDASRVILTSRVTTEDKGYINASYINGYDGEISYIAAQGPLPQTLDDFWLMIWQENVEKIVMLTHLTEGENRVKCEKYWPDKDEEVSYDSIKVKCNAEKTFFSYVLRTLEVSFGEDTRVILQYHFIAWPDKKIPDDSSRLLRFLQEVTPTTEQIKTPVLVHCSAGIGRTGVYIAIERQLKMLVKDGCLNIFNCCQDMRSNRPWMVQTVEQYLFIYECILEWWLCKDTFIATDDFVKKANASDVQDKRKQEFSVLEDVIPTTDELRQAQGKMKLNQEKNRDDKILPQDGWRVVLQREDADSNYINASFYDGFVKPNEFISTQIPFAHTKQDFWEMVYEYDITTIVFLDDGEMSMEEITYWPKRDEDLSYGAIVIHLELDEEGEQFTKRNCTIHHEEDQDEFQCVFLYHLKELPRMQGSLTLLDPVCELLKITGAGRPENPTEGVTLVQCLNGATMSGVFLASKICIDQLELENGTDVFQAVKRVRKVQPKMVETESQFNLVFRIVERYIELQQGQEKGEEATYANYRKGSTRGQESLEEVQYANYRKESITGGEATLTE